jgi:hypothetical protein
MNWSGHAKRTGVARRPWFRRIKNGAEAEALCKGILMKLTSKTDEGETAQSFPDISPVLS